MPASVVKTAADEEMWSKAKGIVTSQYKLTPGNSGARFWKLVMGVFKRLRSGVSESTFSSSIASCPVPLGARLVVGSDFAVHVDELMLDDGPLSSVARYKSPGSGTFAMVIQ